MLYYKYSEQWETFLYSLGVEYIVSSMTNSEIIAKGINIGVDETCLPSKIYLGHVDWLQSRCNMILIPRISSFGKNGGICTSPFLISFWTGKKAVPE